MRTQINYLCYLTAVSITFCPGQAFASEPGGPTLILFFVGLVFAPIIQLLIYPILVMSDAKPWTIVGVGNGNSPGNVDTST